MARPVADAFGKVALIDHRSFPNYEIELMSYVNDDVSASAQKGNRLERDISQIVDGPPASGWTKFHKQVHGYPISFYKTSHGQYEMFRRPSDFLVKYGAAVGDISKIEPIEKIGVYSAIGDALSAVSDHDRMTNPVVDRGSSADQARWAAELEVAGALEDFPPGGSLILAESPAHALRVAGEVRALGHRAIVRGVYVRTTWVGRRRAR